MATHLGTKVMNDTFAKLSSMNSQHKDKTVDALLNKYQVFKEVSYQDLLRLQTAMSDAYWQGYCRAFEQLNV